jgi:hypothetical protein
VDVRLSDSVVDAAARTEILEEIGVDGAFTLEDAHDLFLPQARGGTSILAELVHQRGDRLPRLAHAAYDLRKGRVGRFALGTGRPIDLWRRVVQAAARCSSTSPCGSVLSRRDTCD